MAKLKSRKWKCKECGRLNLATANTCAGCAHVPNIANMRADPSDFRQWINVATREQWPETVTR